MEGEGEGKCQLLHRHYQSLVREFKRLERRLVECQKKQLEVSLPFHPHSIIYHVSVPFQVAQHRDIIQNEYARANLARSKLESLCRELQKHSKQVAVSPGSFNYFIAWGCFIFIAWGCLVPEAVLYL